MVGLVGILFFDRRLFASLTPMNILLMLALLIWTQQERTLTFWLLFAACFIEGMLAEIIGVNTGYLFGHYHYTHVMGPQVLGVPLIIGINWFIVIYCSGILISKFSHYLMSRMPDTEQERLQGVYHWTLLLDGALLTVLFDWVMEPVAMKLNFWQWENDKIPFSNYLSWLALSMIMMYFFRRSVFDKRNQFAVNLLLIQLMFFLILRTFL
jgi:putative membrane protein